MSDTTHSIIRMANQIALAFAHEKDAAAMTAEHISLYWDPRMRAGIKAADGTELSDTARAAVALLHP
jgi:formate dehydrogenase subunit delta